MGLPRAPCTQPGCKGIPGNAGWPGVTWADVLDEPLARIAKTPGRSAAEAAKALRARNPLGRFVRPDEVAGVVAWLCRPDSAAINGQAIVVDGGEAAR